MAPQVGLEATTKQCYHPHGARREPFIPSRLSKPDSNRRRRFCFDAGRKENSVYEVRALRDTQIQHDARRTRASISHQRANQGRKTELLRKEVSDSIFLNERKQPTQPRTTTAVLFEVETALRSYCEAVLSCDLAEHSQADYIRNAENFVRWLKGEFEPGSRVKFTRPRKRS
jgi:hypothetical protein